MEEHGVSKLVSVKFSNTTDDRAKSSESVAKAFGKSENLASEEVDPEAGDKPETSLV
jgi:hypothetical protein